MIDDFDYVKDEELLLIKMYHKGSKKISLKLSLMGFC